MRTIRISEEVWEAIANHGKFGETEEDVLRRVFNLPANSMRFPDQANLEVDSRPRRRVSSGRRRSFATQRMTSFISKNQLYIEFQDGTSSSWTLPEHSDKAEIRTLLNKAIEFARRNGASLGQINAVRKTLTSEGYHLTK
jgi:negative regulator of replication initiation